MNEPYRLRYANQVVGAFLLVILLIGILLSIVLLREGRYFEERDQYWVEIEQSELADLRQGVEITMLGQRVGEIESIKYVANSNQVRVNLGIDSEFSDQIFESSILVPDRKFGLGTTILSIQRGESTDGIPKRLPPGSPIKAYQSETDRVEQMAREVESVSDSVRRIQQKLDPTLSSVDTAATDLSQGIAQSMSPAFMKVRAASESFQQTNDVVRPDAIATLQVIRSATVDLQNRIGTLTEKVQRLVEHDMQETLVEVQQSTDDVSDAAQRVGRTADEVNAGIADTLVTLQRAAESVQTLAEETREVVRIVRREADDLPGTTNRVNDAVSDSQDLVEEIRGHWLLQRTSKRGVPIAPISPSGVRAGYGR